MHFNGALRMAVHLLLLGFISILGQVVILRELNVAFYGVELIYILSLGLWMFWTALGAVLGKLKMRVATDLIGAVFLLFSILLVLDIVFIRAMRIVFGAVPGTYMSIGYQLACAGLSLLPIGILLGVLFQWTAREYMGRGKTLAGAYGLESAGAVIGGLVATATFFMGIGNLASGMICALAASVLLMVPGSGYGKRVKVAGIVTVLGLAVGLIFSPDIDRWLTGLNHPTLIDSRDTPYGRITITAQADQRIGFVNDVLSLETETIAAEEFAHIAAIQRDRVGDVLIAGGGVDGLVGELLKHRPRRIDYVELDPALIDLAHRYFPPRFTAALQSNRVRVISGDPRNFQDVVYDLIMVGARQPSSGHANRFYTREYFQDCARHLKPGGVLAIRLESPENLWSPFVLHRNAGVYHALQTAFSDVLLLPGQTHTLIASNTLLSRDPAQLSHRFKQRGIGARLVSTPYIHYLYTNDRFTEAAHRLSETPATPNSDTRPMCYQYSAMIWITKFFPGLIHSDPKLFDALNNPLCIGIVLMLCCGLFYGTGRRKKSGAIVAVFSGGFIGMSLESMIILYYQGKCGVLYQNLGILLMVFMAGLCAGAFIMDKYFSPECQGRFRNTAAMLFLSFTVLNILFLTLIRFSLPAGITVMSAFLFVTGLLVAAIFSLAGFGEKADPTRCISPLYAADLVGGCLGALLATLILIPFWGMQRSAGILALLSLISLFSIRDFST